MIPDVAFWFWVFILGSIVVCGSLLAFGYIAGSRNAAKHHPKCILSGICPTLKAIEREG